MTDRVTPQAHDELTHWNGVGQTWLRTCLQVAVPLRVAELLDLSPHVRPRAAQKWATAAADVLASEGDAILHRMRDYPDEPGTVRTFNHLARVVAALSTLPNGVEVYGLVWCAWHSPAGVPGEFGCSVCAATGVPDARFGMPITTVRLPELVDV
jgi:hypothetical protein